MNNRTFVPSRNWLREDTTETADLGAGFLLVMTLLSAGLRFYRLDGVSLWVDEILTWNMIRPDASLDFWTQIWDAIQAPLYLLFVWPLVRIQESEFMLRLPAAVAGVLSVPLFGLFLGRILDLRAARLGTLLLAISPFHIWYSQEARGYTFLIFFVILMALAFWEMTQRGPRPPSALGFGLAGACAILSNMSGLFLLMGMGLVVLLFHRPRGLRQWGWWAVAFGLALLLSFPWILKASGIWAVDRILPGAATGESLRGQTTFSPLAIPYSFFTFFFGHSFGPSLRELHQPDRLAVLVRYLPWLIVGAIPVGAGLVSSLRHIGKRRIFLLILVLVPMILLVLLAVRNIKPWNPRYVSVVFPFLLALLSLGLTRLPGYWARGLAVMMVLLSFWSLGGYYGAERYAKADVRTAVDLIAGENHSHEPVFVPVVTGVYSFYDRNRFLLIDSYNHSPLTSTAEAESFFKNKLAQHRAFWFVSGREWYFDPQGLLPVVLSRNGHLQLQETLPGVRVYHWANQAANGTNNE
jgi:4-amino-4-deoxy-L-arabinose transferase-like glycosyltransferase